MYQYPRNIFSAIREERQDFLYNHIQIVDGFMFSQYNTIKKIHKYYNGHYSDGDYETINGITRKKVFWTIGKRRATIATKQIDIDTKDFLLISQNQATEWNIALLEKELKAKLQKEKYGKILNQIADELPVYGSCVLRKTKDGAELIDLRYFFCEQSADNLKKSRYKIIKHFMTPEDMRKMTEWDHTQEAIDKFSQSSFKSYEDSGQLNIQHGTPYIEVYERYAEVPRSFLTNEGALNDTDEDQDYTYARFICAGVDNGVTGNTDNASQNTQPTYEPGIILFKEEMKLEDDPFKEVHFRKTRGRWLGLGIIEDTFEDQRMVNKTKDQEDKAAELAALILFQTASDMVARNVLTDVDNGEILKAREGITRLDNENKSLPAMQKISDAYESHADRETFSADLLGGEQAPASATLGAVNAQLQSSASVYDYKKENFGLFLTEYIKDLVFPDLEKELLSPHVLRFSGDLLEMAKLRERVVDGYIRTKIFAGEMDVPSQEEGDALKQQWIQKFTKEGSKMWIAVEKDFFKNVDYEVSLEITGESQNTQVWLNNLQKVLSIVQSNPLILQNPLYKKILYKMLSAMGMSISELENADAEMTQETMDAIGQMNTKRVIQEQINLKDVPPDYQQGMMQIGGIKQQQQGVQQ